MCKSCGVVGLALPNVIVKLEKKTSLVYQDSKKCLAMPNLVSYFQRKYPNIFSERFMRGRSSKPEALNL